MKSDEELKAALVSKRGRGMNKGEKVCSIILDESNKSKWFHSVEVLIPIKLNEEPLHSIADHLEQAAKEWIECQDYKEKTSK